MATAATKPNPALAPLPFRIASWRSIPLLRNSILLAISRGLSRISRAAACRAHVAAARVIARRDYALAEAHSGKVPDYLPPRSPPQIPGALSFLPGARISAIR